MKWHFSQKWITRRKRATVLAMYANAVPRGFVFFLTMIQDERWCACLGAFAPHPLPPGAWVHRTKRKSVPQTSSTPVIDFQPGFISLPLRGKCYQNMELKKERFYSILHSLQTTRFNQMQRAHSYNFTTVRCCEYFNESTEWHHLLLVDIYAF